MKPYIIYLLIFTMLLSGCAHTTSSPYLNSSYYNDNSTFENILGYGLLAAAATGLVLTAVYGDNDEDDYKHSYSDRHNNRHQKPNKTKPSKKPHKT